MNILHLVSRCTLTLVRILYEKDFKSSGDLVWLLTVYVFRFLALDSILDAVVLANVIYEMPTANQKYITKALDDFYVERFPTTKKELNPTQQLSTVLAGKARSFCVFISGMDSCGRLTHPFLTRVDGFQIICRHGRIPPLDTC